MKKESRYLNILVQASLVFFTIGGYLLTSFKLPQYGLIVALISQIFWFYSSYKAWKESNQIGIFITTIFMTLVISFGIFNYWFN
ncbi:MAG: hypothetical protein WA101_01010 [Minisyncoccia bacterium]